MMSKLAFTLLGICSLAYSVPLSLIDQMQDLSAVESSIREVRSVAPFDLLPAATNYHRKHGDEDDGEIGYARQVGDKGQKGYQHFDSFHKKDGDNYAFEKHDSFGLDEKQGDEEGGRDGNEKSGQLKKQPKAEKYESSEGHSEGDDGSYHSDAGSHGVSGGSGHDEADAANYNIPSGYSYGAGEEYDF